MPRRFPSPPLPGAAAAEVVTAAAASPQPMQSRVLCLSGGAGGPAARRVRLLLRQVLGGGAAAAGRSGRLEVRALHGSGNETPPRPQPGVTRPGSPYSLPLAPLVPASPQAPTPGPGMWGNPAVSSARRPRGGLEAGYHLQVCPVGAAIPVPSYAYECCVRGKGRVQSRACRDAEGGCP